MWKKRVSIALMLVCSLVLISSIAQAATIIECTFDKDWYYPGQTGHITVTVYNDEESTIRVDRLYASINYYYNDGDVYQQTFYNYLDAPKEILQGESYDFNIDFSLPTNIAPGYTTLYVKAETEIRFGGPEWHESSHPTYRPTIYIESPYKDQLEALEAVNQELEATNQQTTNMMYILGAVTVVLTVVVATLFVILRKARSYALSLSAA